MDKLFAFLQTQRLMAIATMGSVPWIANVYFGVDDAGKIYFVTNKKTKHAQHLLENPAIAFNTAWYDPNNHQDRKAIQGTGTCRMAQTADEVQKGIELHNAYFPEFAKRITVEWATDESHESRVWVIEPKYIKFWNDKLYGGDEFEEFEF
ncbi:pyridoxamine 5'-phosphate oxidase family protein [Candidatus Nomurabacteria bacterium]|nr:pyridoxamine 5'-phosphate oxidase family protein [Candidatus Nomurabacteria bacterium]